MLSRQSAFRKSTAFPFTAEKIDFILYPYNKIHRKLRQIRQPVPVVYKINSVEKRETRFPCLTAKDKTCLIITLIMYSKHEKGTSSG